MTKKRFYRKVAFLLVVVAVMHISCTSMGTAVGVEQEPDFEFNGYATEQKDALDAYNAIINGLKSGMLDENIYAGAHMDEAKLMVMLTDLTDEIRSEYLNIVENPSAVGFEQAKYSLKYLHEQVNETVNALDNCPITEYGYYESKNKGYIKIDKDYYDSFVSQLPALYSDCDSPIVFEPGEYYDMGLAEGGADSESQLESSVDVEKHYSVTAGKELMGGMPITTSLGTASIGFCGYYGIMDAIITAGHAVTEGGNTEYGKVVQRKCDNNQYGDYAIIFVDSNYKLTNKVCSSDWGSLEVRTVYSDVPVDTVIHMYGKATQGIRATVAATDISKRLGEGGVMICGLTKATSDYFQSTKGDSGGAVYVPLGNYKVAACGIHSGSLERELYFTPFEHIASAFNPKTSP